MQEQQRPMTLSEKADIVATLSLFPAMTIMVFLRRRLGYRFLDPLKYQVMVLLIWLLAGFSVVSGNTRSVVGLTLFGILVLVFASVERHLRWRDILHGVSWHTYSRGISWFHSVFHWREDILYRFVDPAAAAIVGFLLSFLFPWLGYYIIFAAICLFIFQAADYQRSINLALNVLDGLVESQVQSDNAQFFAGDGQPQARAIEDTAGIPTGVAPDLEAAIARRRARNAPKPAGWQQQPPMPGQTAGAQPVTPVQGYTTQYPPSP